MHADLLVVSDVSVPVLLLCVLVLLESCSGSSATCSAAVQHAFLC